jgi:outer membrane protein assembly factor BamC
VSLQRDGERRWLLVDQPPAQVWPATKAFWTTNGFLLEEEDPRIGIMETDWAENRADIPGGVIRSLLGNVADFTHSAATRDKFRVRLERVDGGTEVFLVHYGVEEVLVGEPGGPGANNPRTTGVAKWRPRPSDPELEAEMLRRLMVYLGADERRAEPQLTAASPTNTALPQPRIQRTTAPNGQSALLIEENYAQAWRLVGLALDRSNYPVEDQNRSQGLYVVGYQNLTGQNADQEEDGLLSNLAFWRSDDARPGETSRHQVRLAGQGSQTLVVVQNVQGQPDQSPEAMRLLDALGEAIN